MAAFTGWGMHAGVLMAFWKVAEMGVCEKCVTGWVRVLRECLQVRHCNTGVIESGFREVGREGLLEGSTHTIYTS